MRKKHLFKTALAVACLLLGGVNSAWAAETIGNVEEAWGSHKKEYTLAAGKSLTINFTVDKTKNTLDYQGWVTNVLDGSDMVFFMQPNCNYAVLNNDKTWNWDSGVATYNGNSYNWTNTNFRDNLQGASVVYNIRRIGDNIVLTEYVTTTATAPTASTTMGHHFVFPYASDNDLTIQFGADAAVLTISDATITDVDALPTVYGTMVGNELNGTTFYTAFSDYYSVAANETKSVYFKNYSNKIGNYCNWVFYLTSDADRGSSTEYLALRSDHYGWGTEYSSGTLTSNYDWSTFRDELDGALVKMTVERSGGAVTVSAQQIAATYGETVRSETFTFTDNDLASNTMRFFLTTEGGHLDILPECTISLTRNNDSYGTATITSTAFDDGIVPAGTSVTVTATPADGYYFVNWTEGGEVVSTALAYTYTATADRTLVANFAAVSSYEIVGKTDCTTEYATTFNTNPIWINAGETGYYKIINHNSGNGSVWNNWYMFAANESSENLTILRPDNWVLSGGTISSFPTTSDLSADLADATVELTVSLADAGDDKYTLTSTAHITKADGTEMSPDYVYTQTGFTVSKLKLYVSVDNSWLELVQEAVKKDITSAGYATYYSNNALDFANADPELTASMITGAEGSKLTLSDINDAPAETGVILAGSQGTYTIPVIASSSTSTSGNLLNGVHVATEKDASSIYVLMNGGNGVGFYKNYDDFTVGANTAYLEATNDLGAREFYGFQDDMTGIESVNQDAFSFGEFFDLQGRRIAQPTKGLYIMNGKKIVIK